MAEAYVKLPRDDDQLVMNTKLAERVFLQSPSTTEFDTEDINFIKQLVLLAIRANDDESLRFIHERAWQIMLLSRKTQSLPERLAEEVLQVLNTTSNVMTGAIYAFLGPAGAKLINTGQIDDPARFNQGPVSRLTAVAVILTYLGQGLEDQIPEDTVDQVRQPLAKLAHQFLHPTSNTVSGFCITNHLEKIMTENQNTSQPDTQTYHTASLPAETHTLGAMVNKAMNLTINWSNLKSANNCAKTWCPAPLPNNNEQLLYHTMNTLYIKEICAATLLRAQSQVENMRLSSAPPLPPRAAKSKRQRRKVNGYSSPFSISAFQHFSKIGKDDQNNEKERMPLLEIKEPLGGKHLFSDMPALEEIPLFEEGGENHLKEITPTEGITPLEEKTYVPDPLEERAYVPNDPKVGSDVERSKTPPTPTSDAEHSDEATNAIDTTRHNSEAAADTVTATCYICYDNPNGYDKTTKLFCNHTFHTNCLHDWLKMQNTCPTCRCPVDNYARGMLLQEPTPKTILYPKTGAVTSTDVDRSRLEIDTMTQSTEAMQMLSDPSRPIIDMVQINPATNSHIGDVGNRGSTGIYENIQGIYGSNRGTSRNAWTGTSTIAYNNLHRHCSACPNRHYSRRARPQGNRRPATSRPPVTKLTETQANLSLVPINRLTHQPDHTPLLHSTIQTLIVMVTLLLIVMNLPTTNATMLPKAPVSRPTSLDGTRLMPLDGPRLQSPEDSRLTSDCAPPSVTLMDTWRTRAKTHKITKRRTWFDYFRTKRSSTSWPPSTTSTTLWPEAVRPNMAPTEEEIDEILKRMKINHANYMSRHHSTENTTSQGEPGEPGRQAVIQGPQTVKDTEHSQCNHKKAKAHPEKTHSAYTKPAYTKAAWTVTTIVMAALTLCITAGAIAKTCTHCRDSEPDTRDHGHIISNPQIDIEESSENIYDSLDFTAHRGYGYTHNKYMPLSLYTHYRSPRQIMTNNTQTRISPSTDQYSITTRSNMLESPSVYWSEKRESLLKKDNPIYSWPEKRESFLMKETSTNWPEKRPNFPKRGCSNVDIYVPMDEAYKTIKKSKSADTAIRIPKAAVLITLVMLTTTLGEIKAQTHTNHLNDIDGKPHSQKKIITKIAGDLLLFESYPTAKQPGLIYEKIDISILDKLQADIRELTKYAEYLHTQVQTTLLTAEFHCPKGPSMLTETMKKTLKVPHYIDAYEIPRSPTKKYIILLTESTETVKRCTYYLSYSLIHKLMARHEHTTSAYYYNRLEKYQNFKSWLFHSTSRTTPCQEGIDVVRGEIASKDTVLSTTIGAHEGALYACTELCQNMAQTFMAHTKMTTQCLGGKCNKTDTPDCKKWSYNWSSKWCRIASKANPGIETSYYKGHNALTASPKCGAMDQHSKVNVLVNSTTREARQICKFSKTLPLGTMAIYKACPGQSVQVRTALIPLKTLLTTYRLQLQSKADRELQKQEHETAINLNNVNQHRLTPQETRNNRLESMTNAVPMNRYRPNTANSDGARKYRDKRATENLDTQIINSLKPKLQSFITAGLSTLATSAQRLFMGSPFTGAMLLIASNLVPLLIQVVFDSEQYVQIEEDSALEQQSHKNFTQWILERGPNLYKLSPNAPCINTPLLYENNIPQRIHDLHKLLSNLQSPLYHVLTNSQPIDEYTKTQLSNTTSHFGFWTKYNKRTKMIERFYVFAKEGDTYSYQRQITAIAGRQHSGLVEGTSILGSTTLPNQQSPAWSCLEVAYRAPKETSNLPDDCYDSPKLQRKEIHMFPFLPHAQIIKIFGGHHLEHKCPHAAPGQITTRGLYIALYPRECSIKMDGVEIREQDQTARSAWIKPHTFINSYSEFEPAKSPKYTDSLENRIRLLANYTTNKQITSLQLDSKEEKQIRYIMDVLAISGLSATATSMLAIGYTIIKRYYQTISNIKNVSCSQGEHDKTPRLAQILNNIPAAPQKPSTEATEV
jgi:hypothetical protein